MFDKIVYFMRNSIGARITPLAYLLGLKQLVLALGFTFIHTPGITNFILFKKDAGFGIEVYGAILLVAAATLLFSMWLKNKPFTRLSSFVIMLSAIWALAVYIMGGYPILAILAVIEMLCWGYIYLASSIDVLWDYTPTRS